MASLCNVISGEPASLIADDVYDIVMANKDRLDSAIIYDRDFDVRHTDHISETPICAFLV